MGLLFFTLFLSFGVAYLVIPFIIKFSLRQSIFDWPSERKIHICPAPSMGGIALYLSILLTTSIVVSFTNTPEAVAFLAALTVIFFVGLKDDVLLSSASKKFGGQLLAVIVLLAEGSYTMDSFYGFLGFTGLSPMGSWIFTGFTMLVIVNAFNLIDGIDGLASLMGISSLCFLGVALWLAGDQSHALIAFASVAALMAFLKYNWSPSRIFLGDTGSLVLGLINAVLVVRFISVYSAPHAVIQLRSAPAFGFALFFLPMADLLRLIVIRLLQGKSPFESDMQHLHHLLLARGFAHHQISLLLVVTNALFIVYSMLFQKMGNTFLILSMSIIGALLFFLFFSKREKPRQNQVEYDERPSSVKNFTRIVNQASVEQMNSVH